MRALYAFLAVLMFALGVIGAFLPVMPTTIFIILSIYFASKSSPQLTQKLKSSQLAKEYYDEDARQLSMTLSRKIRILVLVFITLSITFWLVNILWVRIVLIVVYSLKVYTFIFIVKTKRATI
jgi:uncharacterized membrane protein YbaN (DUF454 family)